MKKSGHKTAFRNRKHHKKNMAFLEVLRFFEGMPLFGIRR